MRVKHSSPESIRKLISADYIESKYEGQEEVLHLTFKGVALVLMNDAGLIRCDEDVQRFECFWSKLVQDLIEHGSYPFPEA